ncbi:MAG TPA: hypothetical protein VH088_16535 [Terriglobales bacterium]|nr:hypothetical protein [Terriglobales bacterium]
MRLALPSATDLIFIVLLLSLSVGVLSPRLLGDAGTGWHIRNGELVLQNHAVTRADPFSASVGGQPWYAWEWLYDAAIAAIHGHSGLNGVVLLTALGIALVFGLVLRLAIVYGATLPIATLFTMLAAGASTIHFLARPHVFSWLFTVIWFWLLDSAESDSRPRRLYWLPLLTVLWVNVHGGFVVGFVLLGIYLVAAIFKKSKSAKTIAIVTTLSFFASFINPYGYQLHLHIYRYLTDRFLMNHIDEFSSPNFHGVAQQGFAVLLLLSMVAVAVRKEQIQASRILVLLFAAYSGLFASRNLPVSSILLTFIAAPVLSRALNQSRWAAFSVRITQMELRSRGHIWPALMVIILFWRVGSIHAAFPDNKFPVQGVDYIAQQNITDPVFCPDDWGGYLIYRLYPKNKVIVDDRHDLYGDDFLRQYLKTIRVEPGWNELLAAQKVRWAILPAGSSLDNLLEINPQWAVRHKDVVAVLFEKK